MHKNRIIPCLLLKDKGLVKGVKFKDYKYIGDPLNAVRIFSEKEVDELIFLDVTASKDNKPMDLNFIQDIADECYMPFCVGGGIHSVNDAGEVLASGAEKISINTYAIENPGLISDLASAFGSQSVVVSIDVKKKFLGGYNVYSHSGTVETKLEPISWAKEVEKLGAGEILINSIDKDGTMSGYDLKLISEISNAVNIPVIACGGAANLIDLKDGVDIGKASAVAAGSIFVFYKSRDAILINYPLKEEINKVFKNE